MKIIISSSSNVFFKNKGYVSYSKMQYRPIWYQKNGNNNKQATNTKIPDDSRTQEQKYFFDALWQESPNFFQKLS